MKTIKTSTFKSTWMGRAATMTTHHLDSSRIGLRVVEMQWADRPGVVEVELMKGDGRTPKFRVLAQGEFSI
jgi:hypothetical protein